MRLPVQAGWWACPKFEPTTMSDPPSRANSSGLNLLAPI
jgi:hypothetical protein